MRPFTPTQLYINQPRVWWAAHFRFLSKMCTKTVSLRTEKISSETGAHYMLHGYTAHFGFVRNGENVSENASLRTEEIQAKPVHPMARGQRGQGSGATVTGAGLLKIQCSSCFQNTAQCTSINLNWCSTSTYLNTYLVCMALPDIVLTTGKRSETKKAIFNLVILQNWLLAPNINK